MNRESKMLVFILIIIAGVFLDQITKAWAFGFLSGMVTYPIIPNVFHFTYVENTGAAFNIFTDMRLFLIIVTLIFIGILGYIFYILPKTKPFFLANLGLSLMLSGAIGNLIDRIRLSYVIDFIELRFINFAVFNVADSLVVIGAFLLLFAYIRNQFEFPPIQPPTTLQPREEPDEEESEQENYHEPIRKDVLKDLKPSRSSRAFKDIRPVVETEIVRLKSHPETFVNTIPIPPVPSEESILENAYAFEAPPPEPDETDQTEVIIINENRYSQLSDKYLESIERQREEQAERESPRNRYSESIDRFENQVQSMREESEEAAKDENVWQPEISERRRTVKTYEVSWQPEISERNRESRKRYESTWQPEITERPRDFKNRYESNWHPEVSKERKSSESSEEAKWEPEISEKNRESKTRYEDQMAHYEQSIQRLKEEAEPVEKEEEEPKNVTESEASKPKQNRYYDYADHYLESIEEIKNKNYLDSEQKRENS